MALSLKKVFNRATAPHKKEFLKVLRDMMRVIKTMGVDAEYDWYGPDYSDFKKWYEWGGDARLDFHSTIRAKNLPYPRNERGDLTDKLTKQEEIHKKIQQIMNKSKWPQSWRSYIMGYGNDSAWSVILDTELTSDIVEQYKMDLEKEEDKLIEKQKDKKFKNMNKAKAQKLALQEIVSFSVTNRKLSMYDIEDIALKYGLDPNELWDEWRKKQDDLFKGVKSLDKEQEKFKQDLVDTTLSRLPRFIGKFVKKIPVTIRKTRGKSTRKSGTLAYYKNGKITLFLGAHKMQKLKSYLHDLAHEYWHAFEQITGFERKAKDQFKRVVDQMGHGNMSRNAIEDFEKVVELVYAYTKDTSFKKTLDDFKKRWTKGEEDYFQRSSYVRFLNDVEKVTDKKNFYESLSEVLAETLGNIAAGTPGKALSQSMVVWMDKKFSSKEKPIDAESLIRMIVTAKVRS